MGTWARIIPDGSPIPTHHAKKKRGRKSSRLSN